MPAKVELFRLYLPLPHITIDTRIGTPDAVDGFSGVSPTIEQISPRAGVHKMACSSAKEPIDSVKQFHSAACNSASTWRAFRVCAAAVGGFNDDGSSAWLQCVSSKGCIDISWTVWRFRFGVAQLACSARPLNPAWILSS